MYELIILFLYYSKNVAAAVDHFQRLQALHPEGLVVPIAFQIPSQIIPGTKDIGLDGDDFGWPIQDAYSQCDKLYYRWFLNPRSPKARRYVFFEYDILPKCSARAFYGQAWNSDIAAADTVDMQTHADWWPGRWGPPVDAGLKPFQTGLRPLAAILWSHDALKAVSEARRMQGSWCEHRAGTLARFLGFRPTVIPGALRTIQWPPEVIRDTSARTWYHPVKSPQPATSRLRRPLRRTISISP